MITTINDPINIHVVPMTSTRSYDAVKNQYVIRIPNKICFQSYNSLIAVYDTESQHLILGCDYDYSRTTSKYLHKFLVEYCYPVYAKFPIGKSLNDMIRKAIKSGLVEYDPNMV